MMGRNQNIKIDELEWIDAVRNPKPTDNGVKHIKVCYPVFVNGNAMRWETEIVTDKKYETLSKKYGKALQTIGKEKM